MPKYICKNYGSCEKADAREIIELPPGSEPLHEDCGFKLELVEESDEAAVGKRRLVIGLGVLGAAVVVGAIAFFVSGSKPDASVASARSPQIAASSSTSTGLLPDANTLGNQKKDADTKIVNAGGVGVALTQKSVIAKEYIKAAIPLMQSGKWKEAEEQLLKAKSEDSEEPLVHYNMAIVKLKQSLSKEALSELEFAFKKGFRDFTALESDADLKPLTTKSEYKALLAAYKAK